MFEIPFLWRRMTHSVCELRAPEVITDCYKMSPDSLHVTLRHTWHAHVTRHKSHHRSLNHHGRKAAAAADCCYNLQTALTGWKWSHLEISQASISSLSRVSPGCDWLLTGSLNDGWLCVWSQVHCHQNYIFKQHKLLTSHLVWFKIESFYLYKN